MNMITKNLYFIICISCVSMSTIYSSYSVADYIREHGQPQITDGTLVLSRKGLTSLSGLNNIANCDTVQFLDLSSNQLTSIQVGDFSNFSNLQHLYLNENKFTVLSANGFIGLGHLKQLSLCDNALTTVQSGAFNGLISLRELAFSRNPLPIAVFDQIQKELPNLNRTAPSNKLCVTSNRVNDYLLDKFNSRTHPIAFALMQGVFITLLSTIW